MKKSIAFLLVLCMGLSLFAGCGNATSDSPVSESTTTVTEPTSTDDSGIQTNENLLTVEITLPASMFEGEDMSAFDADSYAEENGFLSAVVNADNSVTVKMTKSTHNKLIKEMALSLEENFSEYVNSENTPYIKKITHNDDFSSITIEVVRSEYENAWDFTAFSVGVSAMFFQAFLDMEYHVEVSVIDVSNGDVIDTVVYPDAFEE